ncbi:MAG: ATP-binding cassette domain-containing protein [Bacilli bacterium]|nr:ATP-binding cassette domain-containing protein [Bacilli bacterium]MDD4407916.1 ATP-binding cassette domain-containing protein [Bacilli bacterium]
MKTINFKDFNLEINLTYFINIIGLPASGKTTLLKMLINRIYSPNIYIDDISIHEYDLGYKKQNVAVVFNDFKFNTEYVKEELLYYQEKLGTNKTNAYRKIDKFTKYFELNDLIESKIEYLNKSEQALIKILSLLIINPKVLGIDDLFTYLNINEKIKIIKIAKEKNISILNITTDSEDLLLGTHIIILNKFKVISYDTNKNTLKNEKLLLETGFDLPFIINISNGLNYYDITKKTYYKNKDLVEDLWK